MRGRGALLVRSHAISTRARARAPWPPQRTALAPGDADERRSEHSKGAPHNLLAS